MAVLYTQTYSKSIGNITDFPAFLERGAQVRDMPNRALRGYLKKAGLPVFTVHALRHTFASRLLSAGVPVHIVAALLGHTSPNITLSVYAHAIPADMNSAATQIEAALFGTG